MKMTKFKSFTNSVGFKIFLFLVLGVSFISGMLSVRAQFYLAEKGVYEGTYTEYLYYALKTEAYKHLDYICEDEVLLLQIEKAFEEESKKNNVGYVITQDGVRVWENYSGEETPYVYKSNAVRRLRSEYTWKSNYEFYIYVNPDFPKQDDFQQIYNYSARLYLYRNVLAVDAIVSCLFFVISFIWLLCNVGHKDGQEGIGPGFMTAVPLDVLAVFFFLMAWIPMLVVDQTNLLHMWKNSGKFKDSIAVIICVTAVSTIELVWWTVFIREFALRVKLGKWWHNSLTYKVLSFLWRMFKRIWDFLKMLLAGIPMVYFVAAAMAVLTVLEYFWMINWRSSDFLFIGWFVEKIVLIPLTLYCALAFKKLQRGSRALAEGNLSYNLDMKYFVLDFKECGENLNRIGEGISKAVEQRMQSERLKTELITNVSHDIKTPLTSVINYADLLGSMVQGKGESLDQEKVAEYSEVLLRQSQRLKRLLDNLLEASKATTGNLEVNLVPCEIGVMLAQAAGEYEARFAKQGLNLLVHQPEETIRIMADGRHLWRVFDNLFNNIVKYAQEGSRVYLNVETKEDRVEVIFRNMSKYELNVSAKELEERFVRGDKARHMEGNGLGLSIAKSLVELQNGTMELVTDGDLFKVILGFYVLKDEDVPA